jgi:hypothetical protein
VLLRKSPICKAILNQTDEYPQRKERKKNLKPTFKYLHLKTEILSFAQKKILKNNEYCPKKIIVFLGILTIIFPNSNDDEN